MARINYVKKAQKDQGNCGSCNKPIEKGMSYKWVAPRAGKFDRGRKMKRHSECPTWRQSELTSSSQRSTAYAAIEDAYDALAEWSAEDGIEALEEILSNAADGLREAGEMYRESAQNIEDGFGTRTYLVDELEEKADQLESAADELSNYSFDTQVPEESEDPETTYVVLYKGEEVTSVEHSDVQSAEDEISDLLDNDPDYADASRDDFEIDEREEEVEEDDDWAENARAEAEEALASAEGEIP